MDPSLVEETTSFSTPGDDVETEKPSVPVLVGQAETSNCDQMNLVTKTHKVLHFSDGTLDETELLEDEPDRKSNLEVDPKTLSWGPWILYLTTSAGTKTLKAVDYVGETLANFFGITSPKYQYEVDEYDIMCAEEDEAKKRYDLEMGGWTGNATEGVSAVTENGIYSEEKTKDEIFEDTVQTQPHSLQRILYFFAPSMQPKELTPYRIAPNREPTSRIVFSFRGPRRAVKIYSNLPREAE